MKKVGKFGCYYRGLLQFVSARAFATADGLDMAPADVATDVEIVYDATNSETIGNDNLRGANKPTEFFDLSKKDYNIDGTFDTRIYTSYYFTPNEDGEIYYSISIRWSEECFDGRVGTVVCWDKTTNREVTRKSFEVQPENTPYTPVVRTGNRRVYNLNPDHEYFFCFEKTFDTVKANVTGTITH